MEKYCISVDWLQVYCKCNHFNFEGNIHTTGKRIEVKKIDRITPLWLSVYHLYWQGFTIAELCCEPRSSTLDRFGCTLKLENRVLYSAGFATLLIDLIRALNLTYVGITRLDVCYDCNKLHGGREVDSFLSAFLSAPALQRGHIIRSGSRKLSVNASRSSLGVTRISGMRWGSPASDTGAYCYNKSLELLEVKDKPWIRQAWEKAGLVNVWNKEQWDALKDSQKKKNITLGDSENFVQVPVWRFEISIKAHAKDLLDIATGELFRLDLSYLESQRKIESVFYMYAAKVFDFRENNGVSRLRDYQPIQLFEFEEHSELKPIHLSLYADTGRTEKICANVLDRLQMQYNDMGAETSKHLQAAIDFLRLISGTKAGIVRQKKELAYLQHMKAQKFYEQIIPDYMSFVEYMRQEKLGLNPRMASACFKSIEDAVNYEIGLREGAMDSEFTPVW